MKSLKLFFKNEHRSTECVAGDLAASYIQDYADLQYATDVSKEIEEGKSKLFSWEDVKKKYKL